MAGHGKSCQIVLSHRGFPGISRLGWVQPTGPCDEREWSPLNGVRWPVRGPACGVLPPAAASVVTAERFDRDLGFEGRRKLASRLVGDGLYLVLAEGIDVEQATAAEVGLRGRAAVLPGVVLRIRSRHIATIPRHSATPNSGTQYGNTMCITSVASAFPTRGHSQRNFFCSSVFCSTQSPNGHDLGTSAKRMDSTVGLGTRRPCGSCRYSRPSLPSTL